MANVEKDKQKNNLLWIFGIGLLVLIALSAQTIVSNPPSETPQARVFSTLRYCSDGSDEQCAPNTAFLSVRTFARNDTVSERYGNQPVNGLGVVLDEIEIELQEQADERFPEEVWLVADSNLSGGIDSADKRLAQAVVKKKRLLFEDINYSLVNKNVSGEGFNEAQPFFITSYDEAWNVSDFVFTDDEGEPASERIVKEIATRAIDVSDENRELVDESVFADLSLFQYRTKQLQSEEDFLSEQNFITRTGGGNLVWSSGLHEITEDLIIPAGLTIDVEPGTDIRIAPEVSVVSYSPINFNGTAAQPISIDKLEDESFATFAMLGRANNPESVTVNYLHVAGGSEDHINGAVVSGMFSVYRFDTVTVTNSSFTGSTSDDGLNIKNSGILLENNVFDSNSADAFDGDFVVGPIRNNTFISNGNDSLDFSGSDVFITENRILDSGDKCISVGEGTELTAERNILSGCNIGSEVKDRSVASLNDNLISRSKTSGLNAFVKKFFFGEPTASYSQNYFAENTVDIDGLIGEPDSSNTFYATEADAIKEISWYQRVLQTTPQR